MRFITNTCIYTNGIKQNRKADESEGVFGTKMIVGQKKIMIRKRMKRRAYFSWERIRMKERMFVLPA